MCLDCINKTIKYIIKSNSYINIKIVNSVTEAVLPQRIADDALDNKQKLLWSPSEDSEFHDLSELSENLKQLSQALLVVQTDTGLAMVTSGTMQFDAVKGNTKDYPVIAYVPPVTVQNLGDQQFCLDHNVHFPYMAGAMANGIASVELVEAMANENLLASFGAAGLQLSEIESAITRLKRCLKDKTFCLNLIYTPAVKGHEEAVVDLCIKHEVRLIETSAYLKLTLAAVRYRLHCIHRNEQGNVVTPNRIIAKASRIELASKWLSPPPEKMLQQLVQQGTISQEQAAMAAEIPMAQDLTVEADSGGHTDNRPAITLIPTIIALKDRLQKQYNYTQPIRIGAAGGIATPASAAAAFSMGAAYIVTGTINQACQESGSSDLVRKMLAEAEQADVTMAPAVDMFEMGVKLQVLKRGTMFAMRGNKLYDIYKANDSIDSIPIKDREQIEKTIFHEPLDVIWQKTVEFFNENDPAQIEKANSNAKHKMALIFRWYLGLSSRWANAGVEERQVDFQVWMGPAMGAFNEWTKGSFLSSPENRKVVDVAMNILFGAAIQNRIYSLQLQGMKLSEEQRQISPMTLLEINEYLVGGR